MYCCHFHTYKLKAALEKPWHCSPNWPSWHVRRSSLSRKLASYSLLYFEDFCHFFSAVIRCGQKNSSRFVMSLWAGCYAMESRWQGRKLLGKRIQHQTNKYPRKMVGVNLCTSALFGNSFNLLKHFRDPWKKCDAIWEICDKCTPRIIYWLFILARF